MPPTAQLPRTEPASVADTRALLATAHKHLTQGRLIEAARAFLVVSRRDPRCVDALWHLGLLLNQFNQPEEALRCLQTVAQLSPDLPKLNLARGAVLKKLRRFEEAADCCRREIGRDPANADAHFNLGLVLQNLGRLDLAAAAYRQAIRLRPAYVDALVNLGVVLRESSDHEAAISHFEDAIRRNPNHPEPHWERCTTLLSLGQFERGWREYEWRWKMKNFGAQPVAYSQPQWDGSDLAGRRILLHCEQGFGDIIQFSRYAALVARRNGRVILGCPPSLRSVLETIPGVHEVATSSSNLPPFDLHTPLMSLPAIFGTTLDSIPAEVPYIFAPVCTEPPALPPSPEISGRVPSRLRVGLAWAGAPESPQRP